MKENQKLAVAIYEALNAKGAELGNVSIFIIEKAIEIHQAAEQDKVKRFKPDDITMHYGPAA